MLQKLQKQEEEKFKDKFENLNNAVENRFAIKATIN